MDCRPSYQPRWQAVNKSLSTTAVTETTDMHRPLLHFYLSTSNLKLKPHKKNFFQKKKSTMSKGTAAGEMSCFPLQCLYISLYSVNLPPEDLISKETTKELDTQLTTYSNMNGIGSIWPGKVTQKWGNSKHFLFASKNLKHPIAIREDNKK